MLERIDEFIERAYKTACEHGFHDEKTSFCHQMMLVVGEVGEMVEAHRKGYYHFKETPHPKMATVEEWRLTTCSDEYEVSNFGRVRSKDMQVWNGNCYYTKKGRILRAGLTKSGYLTVCLRGIGTKKVSILVANAFLKKEDSNFFVNHIDGNKLNNNVGNLEFVSPSDNNSHAIKTGLRSTAYGKLSYEDRLYIAFEHKKGRAYTSILKDKDFGVTRSAIQRICHEYKKYTDSVEFEMSDVCIRLFDMCGCFGIKPYVPPFEDWAGMQVEWDKLFSGMTLTEQAYHLVQLLGMYDEGDDGAKLEGLFGSILGFIHHWAVFLGVDLATHIDLKMKYNEGRAYKHGKKY